MNDETLTKILCTALGDIEGWTWSETTAYADSTVGVFYGSIGTSPDRAVAVRVYGAIDTAHEYLHQRRVQLRIRGGKNDRAGADRLADEAKPVLEQLSRVGGISGISRQSMAPLGADESGREERSENYLIILDNPEASS